jgi:hypothetical protein
MQHSLTHTHTHTHTHTQSLIPPPDTPTDFALNVLLGEGAKVRPPLRIHLTPPPPLPSRPSTKERGEQPVPSAQLGLPSHCPQPPPPLRLACIRWAAPPVTAPSTRGTRNGSLLSLPQIQAAAPPAAGRPVPDPRTSAVSWYSAHLTLASIPLLDPRLFWRARRCCPTAPRSRASGARGWRCA